MNAAKRQTISISSILKTYSWMERTDEWGELDDRISLVESSSLSGIPQEEKLVSNIVQGHSEPRYVHASSRSDSDTLSENYSSMSTELPRSFSDVEYCSDRRTDHFHVQDSFQKFENLPQSLWNYQSQPFDNPPTIQTYAGANTDQILEQLFASPGAMSSEEFPRTTLCGDERVAGTSSGESSHNARRPLDVSVSVPGERYEHSHAEKKPFPCKICPMVFVIEGDLVSHRRVHIVRKFHQCDVCWVKFSKEIGWYHHMRKNHPREMPFQCELCSQKFRLRFILREHMRQGHSIYKPFQCKICQKRFKSRSYLGTHLWIHEEVKQFRCEICQKRFTQKCTLRKHSRVHIEEKPFECAFCQKKFKFRFSLARHLKGVRP